MIRTPPAEYVLSYKIISHSSRSEKLNRAARKFPPPRRSKIRLEKDRGGCEKRERGQRLFGGIEWPGNRKFLSFKCDIKGGGYRIFGCYSLTRIHLFVE